MNNIAEIRTHISYNAILVSILILYGLFGACVFRKLEAQTGASIASNERENSKEQLLKELWNHRNLEFGVWSEQARGRLDSHEKNLVFESSSPEWSLSDSWLFACTVFTTIGKVEFIISNSFINISIPSRLSLLIGFC